jgi:hypothetical protein
MLYINKIKIFSFDLSLINFDMKLGCLIIFVTMMIEYEFDMIICNYMQLYVIIYHFD